MLSPGQLQRSGITTGAASTLCTDVSGRTSIIDSTLERPRLEARTSRVSRGNCEHCGIVKGSEPAVFVKHLIAHTKGAISDVTSNVGPVRVVRRCFRRAYVDVQIARIGVFDQAAIEHA